MPTSSSPRVAWKWRCSRKSLADDGL